MEIRDELIVTGLWETYLTYIKTVLVIVYKVGANLIMVLDTGPIK